MLDMVKEEMLHVYEKSDECKELRSRVIDDAFEQNVNDYLTACGAVNEIANEYFFAGFELGVTNANKIEAKNNNIELDTDEIIYAIYTHQIQNGGSIADYWSDLNRNLFKQFLKDTDDKTKEAIQRIYNITSEDFFTLGWKTCLEVLRELK